VLFSDEEEDDEPDLVTESGFGNIIVVDNLPVVPPEKYEKLVGVIRKIFARTGTIRESGLWMPVDEETKLSKGYAFIEYNTPQVSRPLPGPGCSFVKF
jgi:translation initiation factor 3 subunit B